MFISRPRRLIRWFVIVITVTAVSACADDVSVPDELYFDSAGVRIHYNVYGDGPDVILIHGLTSTAADNWDTTVPVLSASYRLLTLDVRGHGRSGGPHETGAYGKNMVEDIVRLMDHLSIDQAHIVGYSMGGTLALNLAVDYPHRVRSLVVAGQGWASAEELEGTAAAAQALREAGTATVLIPDPESIRSSVRDRFMKTLASNDALALAALMDDYPQLAVAADDIRETTMPMLLLSGAEDPVIPRIDKLKSMRSDAELILIPDETHLSAPSSAQFVAAIAEFLQDQK
ncbi:MAG: hypothetical protein DRR11_20730 [Gammaproteobacteria bacterium]|nr:MAG: hypothetical protein DRR11_20730 [Gammaproteobacteria bacterium]